ncbi:MAG TPA: helix-turn-helix transcriptional regulator [Actinomycetota bacterium]|nr:helix-turn-helix transcriptional regulator [Actinomycetota bacterium]
MPTASLSPEQAFGEVLRELRVDHQLSQEELALACDRHRTYISLLERGENSPSLRTLLRLATALDVMPSEILRRVEARLAGR